MHAATTLSRPPGMARCYRSVRGPWQHRAMPGEREARCPAAQAGRQCSTISWIALPPR